MDFEKDFAARYEQYIKLCKSLGNSYNIHDQNNKVIRPFGYTFTEETNKMRDAWTDERRLNNSIRCYQPRTQESKDKVKLARLRYLNFLDNNPEVKETLTKNMSHRILQYFEGKLHKEYPSQVAASKELNSCHKTINKYIKQGNLWDGKSLIKKKKNKEAGKANLVITKLGVYTANGSRLLFILQFMQLL